MAQQKMFIAIYRNLNINQRTQILHASILIL